jgi:hypothetical protein
MAKNGGKWQGFDFYALAQNLRKQLILKGLWRLIAEAKDPASDTTRTITLGALLPPPQLPPK